jgi:hypothetical protein
VTPGHKRAPGSAHDSISALQRTNVNDGHAALPLPPKEQRPQVGAAASVVPRGGSGLKGPCARCRFPCKGAWRTAVAADGSHTLVARSRFRRLRRGSRVRRISRSDTAGLCSTKRKGPPQGEPCWRAVLARIAGVLPVGQSGSPSRTDAPPRNSLPTHTESQKRPDNLTNYLRDFIRLKTLA